MLLGRRSSIGRGLLALLVPSIAVLIAGGVPAVAAPALSQLKVTVEPAAISIAGGSSDFVVVRVVTVPEVKSPVQLSASGQPTGATLVFIPNNGTTPMAAQLRILVAKGGTGGTHAITIRAIDATAAMATATLALTIAQEPPPAPPGPPVWLPPTSMTFESLAGPTAAIEAGSSFEVSGAVKYEAPFDTDLRFRTFIDDSPLQTLLTTALFTGTAVPFLTKVPAGDVTGPHTFVVFLEYLDRNTRAWMPVEKASFVFNVVVTPPLSLKSLSVESAEQGKSIELAITGESFAEGAKVSFSPPAGITIAGMRLVGPGTLDITITISRDAPPGPRDVIVTNPDGRATTLKAGLRVVEARAEPPPAVDTTPPLPVTGLAASDARAGKVTLTWAPSGDADFANYAVYASPTPMASVAGLTPVARVTDRATTTYQVTGLKSGVEYHFAVTAVDRAGNENKIVSRVAATISPRLLPAQPDPMTVGLAGSPVRPEVLAVLAAALFWALRPSGRRAAGGHGPGATLFSGTDVTRKLQ